MSQATEHSISIPADQYGRVAGRDVARLLSRMANSGTAEDAFGFAREIAGEHRTLQQSMVGVLLTALVGVAGNSTDDRNAAAVRICKMVRVLLEQDGVYISDVGEVRLPLI